MEKKGKVIVITGVPGTGKSSIAAEISKSTGARIISINGLVVQQGLFSEVDVSDGAKIVLMPKLEKAIKKEIAGWKKAKGANAQGDAGIVVVDGHLACEIKIKADLVLVCRCHPDVLRKRLAARGYNEGKVKANVLSEMLDYCILQCERNFPKANIFEVDTSEKSVQECAQYALLALADKKKAAKKRISVNWADLLFEQEVNFRN
ncbi:Putative adenylate kinase [Candidatus Anstonella stagnisolia]|nr:Putative adenylate kinase [Candidatus Anstonella stagnisolia]